jgi:hypothetical protein
MVSTLVKSLPRGSMSSPRGLDAVVGKAHSQHYMLRKRGSDQEMLMRNDQVLRGK